MVPAEEAEESKDPTEGQPEKPAEKSAVHPDESHWQRFLSWYKADKKKSIPLTVLALILLLALLPLTRYKIGGVFIKKDVVIRLVDSQSKSTIYSAYVTLDGRKAGAPGKPPYPFFFPKVPIGRHVITAEAAYYQKTTTKITVEAGLAKTRSSQIKAQATGRLVSIRVNNKISGKAVEGLQVKSGDSTGKTDWKGDASVVVNPTIGSAEIEISGKGYNTLKTKVKVNAGEVNFNIVAVVPAGKVYFLSKRTGKLDLMKSNLDGSGAEVAVAGTGNEIASQSKLLPSSDWQHVALLTKRTGGSTSQLYVLSADDDKLLTVETNIIDSELAGWIGDSLIYWTQPDGSSSSKLKSYDASSGKTTMLDQITGLKPNEREYYAQVIVTDKWVAFAKTGDKAEDLLLIDANGQNPKSVVSYDPKTDYVQVVRHGPNSLYYFSAEKANPGKLGQIFDYDIGGSATQSTVDIQKYINESYLIPPNYFFSPSGKQSFWSEVRDGKNTLILADVSGKNAKTIASGSQYAAFGWFSDNYLLVSKSNSELYIMDAHGGTPIKISDYQSTEVVVQ